MGARGGAGLGPQGVAVAGEGRLALREAALAVLRRATTIRFTAPRPAVCGATGGPWVELTNRGADVTCAACARMAEEAGERRRSGETAAAYAARRARDEDKDASDR